jgi:hypothetical protein
MSERYVPSLNRWIRDANLPVSLYLNGEIGAGVLLPDGRAFFLGGSGHTALYTPSGTTTPGNWAAGPDIPNQLAIGDGPAAVMANGKVLCIAGKSVVNGGTLPPLFFFEYDSANASTPFVPAAAFGSSTVGAEADGVPAGNFHFLCLPDGSILASQGADTSGQLFIYQPDGAPLAAGKPVINSISKNPDGSYHLTGTGLNGLSQGATFGDDAQMDSNYPLVRLSTGTGTVLYARTFNWNSTSVITGARQVATDFALPPITNLAGGTYSLVVVANGIPSDPISFIGPVWVDFSFVGPLQVGSYFFPYTTLGQATNAVASGGIIAIKSGISHEAMRISKPMTIMAGGGAVTIGR